MSTSIYAPRATLSLPLGGPDLLGLGDLGQVVVLDAGRVGLGVGPEGQLLRREPVDRPMDDLADPAKGIDKGFPPGTLRPSAQCPPSRATSLLLRFQSWSDARRGRSRR